MYIYSDTEKLFKKKDSVLKTEDFRALEQDIKKLRYYSRCLDSSTYTYGTDYNDIYERISLRNQDTWSIDYTDKKYIRTVSNVINPYDEIYDRERYDKFLAEECFTLKNTFEPYKLIKSKLDYEEADFATTGQQFTITDGSSELLVDYIIDGQILKENHRVLVKDQITTIELDNAIDPETYFYPYNYYVSEQKDLSTVYYYYNSDNGLYIYKNQRLVREDIFATYRPDYSIVIKRGDINFDKQFHVSRRKDGYFPVEGLEFEFLENVNFFTRNVVKYKNILDNNYYDFVSENAYDSIPKRSVYVGEFGSIIIEQDDNLNIYDNDCKSTLYSIAYTDKNYIIVGADGTILSMSKADLAISKYYIPNDSYFNFKSVNFIDNLNGIIVGEFNSILLTSDGGKNWERVDFPELKGNNYQSCKWIDYNRILIAGDNGILLELNPKDKVYTQKYLQKIEDSEDEIFPFFGNINAISDTVYSLPSYNFGENFVILSGQSSIIFYFINTSEFICLGDINGTMFTMNTNTYGSIKNSFIVANKIYFIDEYNLYSASIGGGTVFKTNINPIYPTIENTFSYRLNNLMIDPIDTDEYKILGDESKLIVTTDFNVYLEIDSSLFSIANKQYDPKLMFMDYDMGSKMIFFNKYFEYILPERVQINSTLTSLNIASLPNQFSWVDYYRNFLKEFDYNAATFNDASTVKFNNTLRKNSTTYFDVYESDYGYTVNGSTTNGTAKLYVEDTLLKLNSPTINIQLGDVIEIESDIITAKFIVNDITGSVYTMKSYFNDTVINQIAELLNDNTKFVRVRNTNLFVDADYLVDNLYKHYLGDGYRVVKDGSNYYVTAIYNNRTAYYNMQAAVTTNSQNLQFKYKDLFLDFGYNATYNILDFLANINSTIFTPTFKVEVLGEWNLVYNTDFTISRNLILLNDEFVYSTYAENTFIMVGSTKTLLVRKYFENGKYVLETDKDLTGSYSGTVNIRTRNLLGEISDDLQTLNNIHQPEITKNNITTFGSEVTFKFSTENYAKALLSIREVKENLTGIIYVDNNRYLSMNLTKLKEIVRKPILGIRSNFGKLEVVFDDFMDFKDFKTGDIVKIVLNDKVTDIATNTTIKASQLNTVATIAQLNTSDPTNISIETYIDYTLPTDIPSGYYTGYVEKIVADPYFQYYPLDLLLIGKDYKHKPLIRLKDDMYHLDGNRYSLQDVDFNHFRFKLINGINIVDVTTKYQWLLEAEIEDAVIGVDDNNNIQWYDGVWFFGRWFGGDFYKGTIWNMQFYEGNLYSVTTSYTILEGKANLKQSDKNNTIWYNGSFYNGSIDGITWYNGRHYAGNIRNTDWYNGIFDNGTWESGKFMRGVWVTGTHLDGTFEARFGDSIWIDGVWTGGDFISGNWLDGQFYQETGKLSRFGTNPNNSRKAIWESGEWLRGEYHSILRTENNAPVYSLSNKFSIFKTGTWADGIFYGGTIMNVLWNNGTIENALVLDHNPIVIEAMHPLYDLNQFESVFADKEGTFDYTNTGVAKFLVFNDILRFDLNSPFYMIDNNLGNVSNTLGSNSTYGKHFIADLQLNYTTNQTLIEIIDAKTFTYNLDNGDLYGNEIDVADFGSEVKVVSRFENLVFKRGIIENAIISNLTMYSGTMYNGIIENGILNQIDVIVPPSLVQQLPLTLQALS